MTLTFNITINIGPGAEIDPATLTPPAGRVGFPYSHRFSVLGGVGKWTVASGSLPSGVSLAEDGALSGTPTAVGDYTAALSVEVV